MRSPATQGPPWRTKALASVIKKCWALNSPSIRRQDYFARNPTLDECDRLITTGLETRVAKAYRPVGMLPHFKDAKWSPQTVRTVFNFVVNMARECRTGNIIGGRLGGSATDIFWEEYGRLADEDRFSSDLRCFWRLLVRHNGRVLAFNQKLLTLAIRSRLTPEMMGELVPAFTMLYFEIIYEAMLQSMIPRAIRLLYRVFLLRFRHCDFFVSPVCRCCCRRVCTAEFLNAIPESLWPILDSERWREMIDGIPPKSTAFGDTDDIFRCSLGSALCVDSYAAHSLNQLYGADNPLLRGLLRQQVLTEALLLSTRECLNMSLKLDPKDEVATNDFVLLDLMVLSSRLGVHIQDLYDADGWEAITLMFDEVVEKARSTTVGTLAAHFMADYVCNTDYSPVEEPSADEGEPPETIAQKFWLDVYDVLKKSYMSPGDENKPSPCAMNDSPGRLCPLLGAWVRLSIDANVNRTFLTGDLQKLEAFMTGVCLEVINHTKHEWPPSFREDIDPMLEALRHVDLSAPYFPPASQ